MSAFLSASLSASLWASPLDGLEPVGSARLRVLFWTIYDSTLYSPSGRFESIEPGLALEITYHRKISAEELISRTAEEWQKLALESPNQEVWLGKLRTLWPNVQPGDTLTLVVDGNLNSRFYVNDRFSGVLEDADFTRQFLAIWLDANSSYPPTTGTAHRLYGQD